jgi:methylenetetrahydrofolate dehydrogenase (NADP+)/methenyltetrahydrofolate cyclohydrolase
MRLLEGAALAQRLREEHAAEIAKLGFRPKVVAIHNQDYPACRVYLRMQRGVFEKHGVDYEVKPLTSATPLETVLAVVDKLNRDRSVHAITVHLPLPETLDTYRVLRAIDPAKDVEGTHPHNIGMIAYGEHNPTPCAARAAVELARQAHATFRGMEACVVGHGALVGKPIAFLLLQSKLEAPTPVVCHIATKDLALHTRRADLLFVAVGKAGLVTRDMVKPGATVVDIGINKVGDRIVGDVADDVREVAGCLTPVPGGVGPVTLAILLQNLLACVRAQKS